MQFIKLKNFKTLKESDKKFVCGSFIAVYDISKNPDLEIGFICSKRTLNRAVDRNYARRRLKGAIREFQGAELKGVRILIIARAKSIEVNYQKLCYEITNMVRVISSAASKETS